MPNWAVAGLLTLCSAFLPAMIWAQTPSTDDSSKRSLCERKHLYANDAGYVANLSQGTLPYEPDEIAHYERELRARFPSAPQQWVEAQAKQVVEKGVQAGSICDGETVCGSVDFRDAVGKDFNICPNRCAEACRGKIDAMQALASQGAAPKIGQLGNPADYLKPGVEAAAMPSAADEAFQELYHNRDLMDAFNSPPETGLVTGSPRSDPSLARLESLAEPASAGGAGRVANAAQLNQQDSVSLAPGTKNSARPAPASPISYASPYTFDLSSAVSEATSAWSRVWRNSSAWLKSWF